MPTSKNEPSLRRSMKRAVELAAKCESEPGRLSPKVGAVVLKRGKVMGEAYRGELSPGDHAEFTLLQKKLPGKMLEEATLITTLEPCTVRGASKTPCVERVVRSGIRRVLIGTLDPNPIIRGQGHFALQRAGVRVEMFPADLATKLQQLNEAFTGFFLSRPKVAEVSEEFIAQHRERSLDHWYVAINRIYWNRNFDRDPAVIFLHLAELIGGLSGTVTRKQKPGVDPLQHLAKAVGWWLALCGRLGVTSVEQLLWDKFPSVCSYCQASPHSDPECRRKKAQNPGPDWQELELLGQKATRPTSLGQWQRMFATIFEPNQTEGPDIIFARLTEEIGELAESVRIWPAVPGYFLSEAADVFAWLMKLQNLRELHVRDEARGRDLAESLCREYPDRCRYCGDRTCSCPSILTGSVGRITHEVPRHRGSFGESGRFLTPDLVRVLFRSGLG
jgi:pyrimidine deaminase RibD-like protein/NTP pyrophosphatase (non-canonical NTP hydrolase)